MVDNSHKKSFSMAKNAPNQKALQESAAKKSTGMSKSGS